MKVDIYRAKKSPGPHEKNYILVSSGYNVEELPPEIINNSGGLVLEKELELKPGEKRIALDTDEALKNLQEKGYHEQSSKIEITIKVGGEKI